MKLKSLLSILLALTLSMSFAQKPKKQERKLAKDLKKHVSFLASDELAGRGIATSGEAQAAEYIAKEMAKIGLAPGLESGFYQTIPVVNMRMAQGNTSLMINGKVLTLFSQFYPISETANNARFAGEAINVGFGIVDEGLKYDDYGAVNVDGKAVIIDLDLPGGTNSKSKFFAYNNLNIRISRAEAEGAKAILVHTSKAELVPKGELAKIISRARIPVLFVKQSLTEKSYSVDLVVDVLALSVDAQNVIGLIDNQKPHTVILGAHYDHIGRGEKGESFSNGTSEIHNGADANASGVAALLALAKEIKNNPKLFKNYNYAFIAFTGTEKGMLGSKRVIASPNYETSRVNYMMNLDMIGRLDSTDKTLVIGGVVSSPTWQAALKKKTPNKKKIAKLQTYELGLSASDHTVFLFNGIPALHFFTGYHSDYRRPTDDSHTLNYLGEAYIVNYICKLMAYLDKQEKLQFSKTIKLYIAEQEWSKELGLLPDYTYEGPGIRISSLNSNKAASKAGIEVGDILTRVNKNEVKTLKDYEELVSTLAFGEKTEITVKRGEEEITFELQF